MIIEFPLPRRRLTPEEVRRLAEVQVWKWAQELAQADGDGTLAVMPSSDSPGSVATLTAARFIHSVGADHLADEIERAIHTALAEQSTAYRASRRLMGWAVRVLPAIHRPQYEEEFRSELFELTTSGASRFHRSTTKPASPAHTAGCAPRAASKLSTNT